MVSTCANPNCTNAFRKLCDGRLFVIDPRQRRYMEPGSNERLDCYWLCSTCAELFTLTLRTDGQVICIPRLGDPPIQIHNRRFAVEAKIDGPGDYQ